jgi:hypothetical protein
MRHMYAIRDAVSGSWLESTRWVALGTFDTAHIFHTSIQAQEALDRMNDLLRRTPIWWNLGRRVERSNSQVSPVLEIVPCVLTPTTMR